ncbi:uncharacterized protein LOC128662745 [Bombina bombina]|uniref:uncharacterized protein LOC128662745 n=1 Tax=Bombina bombina TaxID=8345 RepID=UPI00235B08DE|nr:uncharacterized protein LOC128662745 [Bombina bombina]
MKIRIRLEGQWSGECALAKVIMPLHILGVDDIHIHTHRTSSHRTRRQTKAIPGSFDPHVYIDAIRVPRGVPDEFKARDQVKAGFESIFPIITANKNVDWINYIFYNQQRFVNYTRDALKGIAEQLGPTSYMTFQNRMALDMLLAEKGGVCKVIDDQTGGSCCTFIPDNTGPTGKVTLAIKKLEELSIELKKNSGIDNPWDKFFTGLGFLEWLKNIGTFIVFIALFILFCYCCFKIVVFCIAKHTRLPPPTPISQCAQYLQVLPHQPNRNRQHRRYHPANTTYKNVPFHSRR